MEAIRNVLRSPIRNSLTIGGITIGVIVLIVMGAMSEKLHLLVEGGKEYYTGKITVIDGQSQGFFYLPQFPHSLEAEIREVDGVRAAFSQATVSIDKEPDVTVGLPPQILGYQPEEIDYETFHLTINKGRQMRTGDRGVAVLGSDLVTKFNGVKIGDTIKLRGKPFKVIGITDKRFNNVDSYVGIPFEDIQPILKRLRTLRDIETKPNQKWATMIQVYPEKGESINTVVKRIKQAVPDVKVYGPEGMIKGVESSTRIIRYILFSVAFISLLVGSLSIVNTMTMAVNERTREIGIRKAVGGTRLSFISQFLSEAAVMSTVAGCIGIGIGWAITAIANQQTQGSGIELFVITPRLVLGTMTLSVVLGPIAGLIPALRASRLQPVTALARQG